MRITHNVLAISMFLSFSSPLLADVPMDFSGEWVAVDKVGDAPSESDSSSTAPRNNHGGRHGHGTGTGSGNWGHGRQHSDPAVSASGDSGSKSVNPRLRAHALIIRQSEVVFDIAADGQRAAYRFDNRNNYGPQYGGTVTLTWATPEMVIETHPEGGGSVEEHYTLSEDGKKLTLLLHMSDIGGSAREVKRVFTRDAAQ
jgi:hypothetical protein